MRSGRAILVPSLFSLLLAGSAPAQIGSVVTQQKLSPTQGQLGLALDDGDEFGWSMTRLGDLDLDGVPDIAVGMPWDDAGGTDRGSVVVLFLNANGTVKARQKINAVQGGFTGVLQDTDWFGWSVSAIGDLDNDGVTELAVGALQTDDGGLDNGALWILFLKTNGTVKAQQKISPSSGNFNLSLPDFEWFGSSVAGLGDFDGDGVEDLAVGAHGDSDGGIFRGAVWVLYLNATGTVKSKQKINDLSGGFTGLLEDGDEFGWSLANLGDLDGDAVPDLAVAAELDDDGGQDRGAVWILNLKKTGSIVKSTSKISSTSGGFTGLLDNKDHFGRSICALGDIDGDGKGDLAVGAQQDDDGATDAGAVWNLRLNANGTVKAHQKISASAGSFSGPLLPKDNFGASIAAPGDLNGDGIKDLVVGASLDDDGGLDTGAAWVLFLGSEAWTDLGFALPGFAGLPHLIGTGTLAGGSPGTLQLSSARPSSLAVLWISFAFAPTKFKGGFVAPVPPLLQVALSTNGFGELVLPFTWPTGLPTGTQIYFQYLIQDPGAIKGVALSNAEKATTP
jgi:hypothetical protein